MQYPANKCIDGDMTGPAQLGNMCHSGEPGERSPWLALDYGTSVIVKRVDIFNRDAFGGRTRNVEVRVSNEIPTSANQMFAGGSLFGHFAGPATDGQHIIIQGKCSLFLFGDHDQHSIQGKLCLADMSLSKWITTKVFRSTSEK